MRRLDTETVYSKRTYFFGIIAFICFLIQRSFVGIYLITGKAAPLILEVIIAMLFTAVTVLAFFCAIKSLKEPTTFKKIIGLVATVFAILQLSLSLASLL